MIPLLDRVLVQRFKPQEKTASGLFLPSSSTSSPLPEATVVSSGPGAPDKDGKVVPVSVKAGDKVLLPGWGGSSIKVGEEVSMSDSRWANALEERVQQVWVGHEKERRSVKSD